LIRRSHAAITGLAIVGVAGGVWFARPGDSPAPARPSAVGATAVITRGDLVDTTSVDGRLTYAGQRKIVGAAAGTVTRISAPGTVIEQGEALYSVNRRPVVLIYGRLPLYRTLRQHITDGPDVRQLERALRDIGHGGALLVDDHFTAATARAVRAWQRKLGLRRTGTVDASQVVFLPGKVRVAEAKVAVGDKVGGASPVLTVTATRRVVHVDLKAEDQDMARPGTAVTVELPDGVTTPGRIVSVGAVARKADSQDEPGSSGDQSTAGSGGEATVDVQIELTNPRRAGRLDQTPVTVGMERSRRVNVLTVPVEALLALREGGFGVEVIGAGGARRIVAVRTGAYGGGRVEISGSGLAEGVRVGVPVG
jgi:peptidoglycan hydrolase-like protein with peptidoglycan-binding domain